MNTITDDRKAAQELLLSYAQDIVNMWPNISFRTLRSLHEKVMGLKDALEMLGK